MPKTHVFIDKRNRALVTIPSFLRDMYCLENRDEIEILPDGDRMILIPKKKVRSDSNAAKTQ